MHFKKIICHHKVVERCVPVFNKFFMKKIIARAEKKEPCLLLLLVPLLSGELKQVLMPN